MIRTVKIRVQPRSSVRKVIETDQGEYKVYTNKPAVDGQANSSVIEMMAKHLKIKKNQLQIKQGHTSRNKVLEISEL